MILNGAIVHTDWIPVGHAFDPWRNISTFSYQCQNNSSSKVPIRYGHSFCMLYQYVRDSHYMSTLAGIQAK